MLRKMAHRVREQLVTFDRFQGGRGVGCDLRLASFMYLSGCGKAVRVRLVMRPGVHILGSDLGSG
jgi:hypothetical protein